jgi:hypothetical protein
MEALVVYELRSCTEGRNATGELERAPAPLCGVMPDLPVALKPIRLHQVWQATPAEEPDEQPDRERGRDLPDLRASRPHSDQIEHRIEPVGPVSRITLRPHDPTTGEEVGKDEVVRGYEYERGQYVTFTPDELKALDLESSKVIDLEMGVPRGSGGARRQLDLFDPSSRQTGAGRRLAQLKEAAGGRAVDDPAALDDRGNLARPLQTVSA